LLINGAFAVGSLGARYLRLRRPVSPRYPKRHPSRRWLRPVSKHVGVLWRSGRPVPGGILRAEIRWFGRRFRSYCNAALPTE
jgi:hypothetical protein